MARRKSVFFIGNPPLEILDSAEERPRGDGHHRRRPRLLFPQLREESENSRARAHETTVTSNRAVKRAGDLGLPALWR
jgi:hypothetical protein